VTSFVLLVALFGEPSHFVDKTPVEVVDLTYPLGPHTPTFGGKPQFSAREVGGNPNYSVREVELNEHTGTHVDAPAHFAPGHLTVDALGANALVAPAVVVDVREKVRGDADYRISAQDLIDWEKKNGRIPYGALVIGLTGWSAHYVDPRRYRGEDAKGVLHFPGFGEDAVDWLVKNRPRIAGLGIDTLSVDHGPAATFPVHKKSHAAGFYHVENLDRPERLPAKGALIVVGAIPFVGGSGAPARVIALIAAGKARK
jgi:kynurenine formamidase